MRRWDEIYIDTHPDWEDDERPLWVARSVDNTAFLASREVDPILGMGIGPRADLLLNDRKRFKPYTYVIEEEPW